VVEALHRGLGERLIAVVLFGSRARGDAHEGSDWDVLVIAEGLPSRPLERQALLKALLPDDLRAAVSILAKVPEEFEARVPSLYLDIATDGRILYDPSGYAAAHLSSLQRTIARAGLYRERTEHGDVWQWRDPPRGPWKIGWGS
jgi:predicted nucleotidyltransferase